MVDLVRLKGITAITLWSVGAHEFLSVGIENHHPRNSAGTGLSKTLRDFRPVFHLAQIDLDGYEIQSEYFVLLLEKLLQHLAPTSRRRSKMDEGSFVFSSCACKSISEYFLRVWTLASGCIGRRRSLFCLGLPLRKKFQEDLLVIASPFF